MKCFVCGSEAWAKLPDPSPIRSITTSGLLVNQPLGKSHCKPCGLVQRTEWPFLGLGDFYERNYKQYYERPGTELFNSHRYAEIANWVIETTAGPSPKRVLEIGCGRGWTMVEMSRLLPDAKIIGVEPALENSGIARRAGLQVYSSKIEDFHDDNGFDLIYSNHVLQHTIDPVEFVKVHDRLLQEDGLAVITVQDSSTPSNELLYSDQNFSFLQNHLLALVTIAGMEIVDWRSSPNTEGLRHSQMVVFRKKKGDGTDIHGASKGHQAHNLTTIFEKRCAYLDAWTRMDDLLMQRIGSSARVFNFGAGMYSYLLSCYCEKYWSKVDSCIVDGFNGQFMSKPVLSFDEISFGKEDVVVLGVSPSIQKDLHDRLSRAGVRIVCWDDIVDA